MYRINSLRKSQYAEGICLFAAATRYEVKRTSFVQIIVVNRSGSMVRFDYVRRITVGGGLAVGAKDHIFDQTDFMQNLLASRFKSEKGNMRERPQLPRFE